MSRVNVRKCVERALDSLSEESFDRFRNELVERRQEPRVTLNKVEKKRPFEVAKVMISTFKEDGALEVTKELLEEIGCSQDAEDMIKAAMEAGCCPPAAGGAAGAQTEVKAAMEAGCCPPAAGGAAGAQTEDQQFDDDSDMDLR